MRVFLVKQHFSKKSKKFKLMSKNPLSTNQDSLDLLREYLVLYIKDLL
ncbi:MAG: hypothetical protein ACI9TO_000394 [Rickettsiales bacterium]|jgi:hypothetical protein